MLPTEFENKMIEFDLRRLNNYILEHKDLVYIFYTKIIDVELPKSMETQFETAKRQESKRVNLLPQEKDSDAYNLE